jgi:hypothetical protein
VTRRPDSRGQVLTGAQNSGADQRRSTHAGRDALGDHKINLDIRAILDVTTIEWGVQVTLVELKNIRLPEAMKRAMARQAEAEQHITHEAISLGLEDNPNQWHPGRCAWTALDDL